MMKSVPVKMKNKKEKSTKAVEMKVVEEPRSAPPPPPTSSGRLPAEREGTRVASSSSSSSSSQPRFLWKETYWSVVTSLSFLCTGLVRAYTSPALLSIQNERENNNDSSSNPLLTLSPAIRNDLISWIASIAPLASFLGTILSGPCLDQLGRRKTLFLLTLPSMLGWILVGNAFSISSLLMGRALTGFASGLATATAPLYISEVCQFQSQLQPAERKRRDWLGLLPGILLATGILLGFVLEHQFQHWKKLAQVISVFPFLLCVLSFTIPESPLWLEGRKKLDEIKFDLEMEEVIPPPSSSSTLSYSSHKTKSNLSEKSGLIPKPSSLFTSLLVPISILMILQQFSGGNVLVYYLSEILTKSSKTSSSQPNTGIVHQASLIIGLVQFIGFLLALPLIGHRRAGQRRLLIISAVLMSIAHLILGFHFHTPPDYNDKADGSWTPSMIIRVSSLSLLFCCYSIDLGPIPFLFIQIFSEKSKAVGGDGKESNKVKSYISSVASLVNHLALFCVVKGFPYLFHMEGYYGPSITFWVAAGVCWTAALFTFYFVPASSASK